MTRDEICTALNAPSPFIDGVTEQQYNSDEIATAVERFGALLRTPMALPVLLQSVAAQVEATIPAADMGAGDGRVHR